MFNLRKKAKQVVQDVKKSFEPVRDSQVVIAEIHEAFDSATDKLLVEAKEILSKEDNGKGKRLKNLGFVSANDAIRATVLERQKAEKQKIASLIEYYSVYYPNNKFITEQLVKKICEKYGLVFGDACYYKGDVPEKNIAEMESFKLRDDEKETAYPQREAWMIRQQRNAFMQLSGMQRLSWDNQRPRYEYETPDFSNEEPIKRQPAFKICAPEKDFDMTNLIRSGHKLELNIPDPIVLQPVNGGYLIVTKWGLEGQDESLVNEIKN